MAVFQLNVKCYVPLFSFLLEREMTHTHTRELTSHVSQLNGYKLEDLLLQDGFVIARYEYRGVMLVPANYS